MSNPLQQWRTRWERAGVATIPLAINSKKPVCDRWQISPPFEQWSAVGPAFRGNIGVRAGNGLVVADADSRVAVANLEAFFLGLGLCLPTVATPSGGRHFYMLVEHVPNDLNFALMSPSVGPGELRVKNAYVAAPCSIVDSIRYRFVSGSPEAIRSLTPLRWHDVAPLIGPTVGSGAQPTDDPPVRLLQRGIPPRAAMLLEALRSATKGPSLGRYPSRSEGEAAVVSIMILAGWHFEEIAELFEEWRPGHYWEQGKRRHRYLERTYCKELAFLSDDPRRIEIARAFYAALRLPWPSRTGAADSATYLAFLAVAWQFRALEVAVSVRDLALHTGRSRSGITGVVRRLQRRGLVQRVGRDNPQDATVWRIAPPWSACIGDVAKMDTSHSIQGIGGPDANGDTGFGDITHELWCTAPFSIRSAQLYMNLDDQPKSANELARMVGIHRSTAGHILGHLQMHGLASHTTTNSRGQPTGWIRGSRTLDEVAEHVDVAGIAARRHAQFDGERELLQEWCQRSMEKKA